MADTPQNRALVVEVANDPAARLMVDRYGNTWYARTLSDGRQVWVQARGNKITNAGINEHPRRFDPESGLKKPNRPW